MPSVLDLLDRPHLGSSTPRRRLHPMERIRRNSIVYAESGCWIWTGRISSEGYAHLNVSQSGYKPMTILGHRAAYELTHGRIPDGLVADHLCGVRACVNPDHLEPVVQRENVMRSGVALGAVNAAKTHCPRGHEYTPENTYTYRRPGTVMRQCRECVRINGRASRARRAAVAS